MHIREVRSPIGWLESRIYPDNNYMWLDEHYGDVYHPVGFVMSEPDMSGKRHVTRVIWRKYTTVRSAYRG